MATETSERKPTKSNTAGPQPPEAEHLPCPRCDSTNTKFCYYNNYNFSQPRHFCKSCRRYWTHGGTLRDIPIGGGSRKNAKRSRAATNPASASAHHSFHHHLPAAAASPLLLPSMPFMSDAKMGGSFTSLLNSAPGNGLLALGGFGLGLDDVGFGLGRVAWPFGGVVESGPSNAVGGNTWQVEHGDGGFVGAGGDYFAFPDLAISTPRSVLK